MKAMKQNKIFLSMAALVLVGAMIAGCSSDDNLAKIEITQPEIDNGNQTAVYTITVNLDEGNGTRAVDPSTGVKTFAEGDQIALIYKDNSTNQLAKLVSNALTDADIASGNKSATFSFNSTPIPVADSEVRYIYPASMAAATMPTGVDADNDGTVDYSALANQNGTASSLANVDLGIYDGTASGTVLPTSFTLVNPLTIGAFTIKNNATDGDITNTINKLTISDGTNTYTVNTSTLSTIYVAMKPFSDTQTVVVQATDGTTHYVKTVTGKTLAKNNITPVNVKMFTGTPASSALPANLGDFLGADGFIYANTAAATATGTTAVAMIAYLGNESDCTNGLAIELSSSLESKKWDDNEAKNYAESLTAVPGGTWRLPSKADWQNMFLACRKDGDASSATDDMNPIAGFKEKIAATGISWISGLYWTASASGSKAWYLSVDLRDDVPPHAGFRESNTSGRLLVRGCLAF
jgi:hypothetical protein